MGFRLVGVAGAAAACFWLIFANACLIGARGLLARGLRSRAFRMATIAKSCSGGEMTILAL